jgi:aryl-alcohol dehydrogenase-like predicted oxidoreductase
MSRAEGGLLSRRGALALCAGAGAGLVAGFAAPARAAPGDSGAQGAPVSQGAHGDAAASTAMRTRPIPHSSERLPVIGVGTSIVFDVGSSPQDEAGCTEVVRALIAHGGTVIDTAPSYGAAEGVVGDILTATHLRSRVFLATKLERDSFDDPAAGLRGSLQRLRTTEVDLLQLHNVSDPNQDLAGIRALKSQGLCRYTGITTTFPGAHAAAEAIVRREKPDFLEIDYALDNREAEERVLPAAVAAGTAVLVALPFGRGRLFRLALGKALPPWAAEIDCTSWAQFFLKYVLGNPAVTAVIPGTDKAVHMIDDAGAGLGRLPDAAMRARMVSYVQSLS